MSHARLLAVAGMFLCSIGCAFAGDWTEGQQKDNLSKLSDFQKKIETVRVGEMPVDLPRNFEGYLRFFNRRLKDVKLPEYTVMLLSDPETLANSLLKFDLETLRKQDNSFLFEVIGISQEDVIETAVASLNLRQFLWLITCLYQSEPARFERTHPVLTFGIHPILCLTPNDRVQSQSVSTNQTHGR